MTSLHRCDDVIPLGQGRSLVRRRGAARREDAPRRREELEGQLASVELAAAGRRVGEPSAAPLPSGPRAPSGPAHYAARVFEPRAVDGGPAAHVAPVEAAEVALAEPRREAEQQRLGKGRQP